MSVKTPRLGTTMVKRKRYTSTYNSSNQSRILGSLTRFHASDSRGTNDRCSAQARRGKARSQASGAARALLWASELAELKARCSTTALLP